MAKFEVEMHTPKGVRVVDVPDETVTRYAEDLGKMIGLIMLCGGMGRKGEKDPVQAGDIVRLNGKRYLLKFQGYVEI